MHNPGAWFRRSVGAAIAAAAAGILCGHAQAEGLEADWMRPEEFQHPVAPELGTTAERTAEAHANYLQAVFLEEEMGPDAALESKRRVLFFDPGFASLAVEVAQHHLHRGETPEAISVLKDAKKAAPEDPVPSLALASVYLRHLQKPQLAERHGLDALRLDPLSKPAHELLWEIHRATGQSHRIEPMLRRAEDRKEADAEFLLTIADLRMRETARSRRAPDEDTRERISNLLERIEKLGAKDPDVLERVADLQAAEGRALRAADLYEKALSIQPNREGVREKLARTLVQLGNNDRAAEILAKIVAADPVNLAAYDQLSKIHLLRGEFASAAATMRQALLLAPIDPRRHDEIIRTCLRAREHEAAVQAAFEAESKFPYLPGFTVLKAITLSQAGRHAEAMMAFERALVTAANSNPGLLDNEFFLSYGSAAERAGHHVKAAELLKKSISLAPGRSAEACNYLGYMWAERGENLAEAEQLILRALEQDPGNGAYMDSLGWVYFRQGRYEEALVELLRASEALDEPDPVVLDHIGDAFAKLGKTAEAVLYWRKSLQLDPQNQAITEKLDARAAGVAKRPGTD